MPGRQQTFDLIPTSLVRSAGQKPPMTSKQAKKAYQKANRTPRLSRAEQRRLEAEERARQKEEYEKERAAQKARAARERKAQKEQAQREARKKMGLPEPSKFVRASQPTISRFVVAGGKRSWQAMEAVVEESDGTMNEPSDDDCPPAKRMAADDSGDEFGDFPPLSQLDLPALFDAIDTPTKQLNEENVGAGEVDGLSSLDLPRRKVAAINEENAIEEDGMIDEMVEAQLLSEAVEASSRSDEATSQDKFSHQLHSIPVFEDDEEMEVETSLRDVKGGRRALAEQHLNVPTKAATTIPFVPTPPKPRQSTCTVSEDRNPPSATQVFLENHLDDFFPSPSQEIRELLEDANDLPSNTQIIRELNLGTTVRDDDVVGMFSTQDFVLSSQDLLEISTPRRGPLGRLNEVELPAQSEAAPKVKGRFFEEKDDDLLHAAIHESKVAAERQRQQQKEQPKKPSRPSKRTLQRIQSAATDYGDDDFNDCEKELLALF